MLLDLFQWVEQLSLSIAIRETRWAMPIFLTFHAVGLTLLIGTIVIVGLRLIGLLMPNRPISEIAAEVRRWSFAGLTISVTSGLLLFIPEPLRWYHSASFWTKMSFLCLAILFHFTVFRRVTQASEARPSVYRLCGILALLLWYGVAFGGRALTFE